MLDITTFNEIQIQFNIFVTVHTKSAGCKCVNATSLS